MLDNKFLDDYKEVRSRTVVKPAVEGQVSRYVLLKDFRVLSAAEKEYLRSKRQAKN